MDVLRLCNFRIFIANLNGFSWYSASAGNTGPCASGWDQNAHFLHYMFIEGRVRIPFLVAVWLGSGVTI
jgi:hypothetical protein